MSGGFNLISPQTAKIARFLGAGILNTVFGYAVYAGLLFINISYLTALLVATVAGVAFNYISFGKLVFGVATTRWVFAKFVFAYFLIYVVNATLLGTLNNIFLVDPLVGQILCIPPSVLTSWVLMNFWVYKNDK